MNGKFRPASFQQKKPNPTFVFSFRPTWEEYQRFKELLKQSIKHFIGEDKKCSLCGVDFKQCKFYTNK
jgi:hypothetical protein